MGLGDDAVAGARWRPCERFGCQVNVKEKNQIARKLSRGEENSSASDRSADRCRQQSPRDFVNHDRDIGRSSHSL
jgi:hypothetical protein